MKKTVINLVEITIKIKSKRKLIKHCVIIINFILEWLIPWYLKLPCEFRINEIDVLSTLNYIFQQK